MDSITQILLGASVAAAVAPKEYRKRAILTGAILGTLPDLDVFISYSSEVNNFTSHRGFSHSLITLPLLSIFLLPLLRRCFSEMSWGRLYMLIMLSLITHPLLDMFTSYGTQLFWPIPVTPTFIASVFIVDPLYSIPLLIGLAFYLSSKRFRWVNMSMLALSTLYLFFGLGMQQLAKSELAKQYPNTQSDRWFVGALNASPFCWHGVYRGENSYIETAFNVLKPQNMAVREYPILAEANYPKSSTVEQLLWFNPNTVMRNRNGQIITSDLRMGEFGQYMFEFIVSPKKLDGTRLPKNQIVTWSASKENQAAKDYMSGNSGGRFQKKWEQFTNCLTGGL